MIGHGLGLGLLNSPVVPKSPSELGASWRLTAQDPTKIVLSSGVASWTDSIAGKVMARGSATGRPTYNANDGDGKASITFDGTMWLDVPTTFTTPYANGGMLVVLMKVHASPSFNGFALMGSAGTNPSYPNSSGDVLCSFGSTTRKNIGNPQTDLSQWHVFHEQSIANEVKAGWNGQHFYYSPINTVGWNGSGSLYWGNIAPQASGFKGTFREIIYFATPLSDSDLASLVAWCRLQAVLTEIFDQPQWPLMRASNASHFLQFRNTSSAYLWAQSAIFRSNGNKFLFEGNVGNGTVLGITGAPGTFCGPSHTAGNYTCESVTCDSSVWPAALVTNGTATFTFNYYNAYRLVEAITVNASGIASTLVFTGLDAGKSCSSFYGRLWTMDPRLTKWAAYDAAGNPCGGTDDGTISNTGTDGTPINTTLPVTTSYLLLQDPSLQDGQLIHWTGHLSSSPAPFIQDRTNDNKLYLELDGMEGACNKSLSMTEEKRFFTYAGAWPPATIADVTLL